MSDERPITEYGKLISGIVVEDDPLKRAQMGQRLGIILEYEFGKGVDVQQAVRVETEEWLRQRVGEMNDVVSQVNQEQQTTRAQLSDGFGAIQQSLSAFRASQEAAAAELRREFQGGLELIQKIGEQVDQLETVQAEHGERLDALTQRADTADDKMAAMQAQISLLLDRAKDLGIELGYDRT